MRVCYSVGRVAGSFGPLFWVNEKGNGAAYYAFGECEAAAITPGSDGDLVYDFFKFYGAVVIYDGSEAGMCFHVCVFPLCLYIVYTNYYLNTMVL